MNVNSILRKYISFLPRFVAMEGRSARRLATFLLFFAVESVVQETEPKLVCYHTNWAVYRPEPVNFTPQDIDPFMCTHIIYSFAKVINEPDIGGYGLAPYDDRDITDPWVYYNEFTDLKKVNPDLKTILAVGGATHPSTIFSDMVMFSATRKQFIDHSILWLRQWNFDGLDLDWHYPGQNGGKPSDKQGYVDLVAELRAAYIAESESSGLPRMTVSMAVPAGEYNIDLGYDVPGLSANLDFVNLLAFNLHGAWESDLGHHTSLFPGADDEGDDRKFTVSYAADKWVRDGCPSGKLIVGLAMYGRHWMVGNSCNINSGANGAGAAGPYTGEEGLWAYYEICTEIKNGMTVTWDNVRKVPYGCDSKHWVGYDNVLSLYEKAMFIQDRGLGGGMVWALDLDDYTGQFCDAGPWPLMTQVKKYIRENYQPTSMTQPQTTLDETTYQPTSTTQPQTTLDVTPSTNVTNYQPTSVTQPQITLDVTTSTNITESIGLPVSVIALSVSTIVGVFLCIIIIIAVILLIKRSRKNNQTTTHIGEDNHEVEMPSENIRETMLEMNAGASLEDGEVEHTYFTPIADVEQTYYLTLMENVDATNAGASRDEGDDKQTYLTPMENLPIDFAHVTFDHLRFIKELGCGQYGSVWLAETNIKTRIGIVTKVAVKTNRDDATASEKGDLMREMTLMKKFKSHPNVLELLGSFTHEGSYYLILEFMANGTLRDVLRESRKNYDYAYATKRETQSSLSQDHLMAFAKQVADGMDFITSNHCVHRDLAARNVLVSGDLVCKVSDFGLTREEDEYHRKSDLKLPLRWMAIESIVDGIHTSESDVWSYGVLLWEIVTLGARPYPGMGTKVIVREVRQGYRMSKPSHCYQEVYDLMLACWSANPSQRPSFANISRNIETIVNSKTEYILLDEIEDQLYHDIAAIDDDDEKI